MGGIGHNGGPAFPYSDLDETTGMSQRDYFAGQALVGFLADRSRMATNTKHSVIATQCYEMADAMLAARRATP